MTMNQGRGKLSSFHSNLEEVRGCVNHFTLPTLAFCHAERIALNTPIQGTAADIIKIAMINLYNEFNKNNLKSKILVQVHDELVIDCKESEYNIVCKLLKEVMENVVKLDVPLTIDIESGTDWYQAK